MLKHITIDILKQKHIRDEYKEIHRKGTILKYKTPKLVSLDNSEPALSLDCESAGLKHRSQVTCHRSLLYQYREYLKHL